MPKPKPPKPKSDSTFKTVKGFSKYEVSKSGSVRNKSTGKVLSPKTRWDGYSEVCLMTDDGKRSSQKVHLLGARTHLGVPKGKIVNHKDGLRENQNLKNLEVTSISENNKKSNQHKNTYKNKH